MGICKNILTHIFEVFFRDFTISVNIIHLEDNCRRPKHHAVIRTFLAPIHNCYLHVYTMYEFTPCRESNQHVSIWSGTIGVAQFLWKPKTLNLQLQHFLLLIANSLCWWLVKGYTKLSFEFSEHVVNFVSWLNRKDKCSQALPHTKASSELGTIGQNITCRCIKHTC